MEEIRIKSISDIDSYAKITLRKSSEIEILFSCEECGKDTSVSLRAFLFGKKNNLKCSFCQRKEVNTKKYGGIGFSSPFLKEKTKKTISDKYGSEFISQNENVKARIAKKLIDYHKKLSSDEIKLKVEKANETKKKNKKSNKEKNDKIKEINIDESVDNLTNFKLISSYSGQREESCLSIYKKYIFYCNDCGNLFYSYFPYIFYRSCPFCGIKGINTSSAEKEISSFIKEIYDGDIIENDRKILDGKEIDICLPDIGLGIEYDGLYWHSSSFKEKSSHREKTLKAREKNIDLIHIFEDEWMLKKQIVESIIANKIGLFKTKVYARECYVETIDNDNYKKFCEENHIQGYARASIKLGLKNKDGELLQIMSFSKSRFNKRVEWEMIREASRLGYVIIGGKGKLLKFFERTINPMSLISYCDIRYFSGKSYEVLGFELVKETEPGYFYFKGLDRRNRVGFQKSKLKQKLDIFDCKKTEIENMLDNNWNIIFDCGQRVYIKTYKEFLWRNKNQNSN